MDADAESNSIVLCDFVEQYDGVHKRRYVDKLTLSGLKNDPYLMPDGLFTLCQESDNVPDVQYPDIYNYLINTKSGYTAQSMKAYKSLAAYQYFVAGFVSGIKQYIVNKSCVLVMAKVKHSQRMSEPPLKPWILIQMDGSVTAAHCNCMAGLAEGCSHVAAVLFALEAVVQIKKSTACTSVPCSWMQPSTSSKIEYLQGVDIDFTSPQTKRKHQQSGASVGERPPKQGKPPQPPTQERCNLFYERLHKSNVKSSVLSTVHNYCESYVPVSTTLNLPQSLDSLYNSEVDLCTTSLAEVLEQCEGLFSGIHVTQEQSITIEKETRQQSKCRLWSLQRIGRVTASRFKSAARAKLDPPPVSLLKQICYPEAYKFSTAATRWGCNHEEQAKTAYREQMLRFLHVQDTTVEIIESGLHIHPDYPHLGATPDALINCACCGKGVLEVKCPYCRKDQSILQSATERPFCLRIDEKGVAHLKKDHSYYYQVQAQMFLSNRTFCHFVIWTPSELFCEVIVKDNEFFFSELAKVTNFFKKCVLPELYVKYFTGPQASIQEKHEENGDCNNNIAICYCKSIKTGNILTCASDTCQVKQFHQICVGLKNKPQRQWYCCECRLSRKRDNLRKGNNVHVVTNGASNS